MNKKGILRPSILLMAAILLFHTLLLVYFGSKKLGFHEDEMATFSLSNHPDGFFFRTESLMHQWVNGSEFLDVLTVSEEERFDYQMVYQNQESDVHPPLYYYVIHTLSSLFEGQFSKWIGLVPNIVFCLLTSVIMFLISKKLMKSDALAALIAAVWAFSTGAVDTVIFIRMYAMLTLLTSLFVFLHLKALDQTLSGNRISAKWLVLLFLNALAGLLTQYYFSVFALFLCGLFTLYLLFAKRWRDVLCYLIAECSAVASAILYYPAMLEHILGNGYRGKQAFSNLYNSSNFLEEYKKVIQIISGDLLNGWVAELFLLCAVLLAFAALRKLFRHLSVRYVDGTTELRFNNAPVMRTHSAIIRIPTNRIIVCSIGIVFFLYSLLISKVAPFQADRYYMAMYPLFVLCVISLVYWLFVFILRKQTICKIAVASLFLIISVCGLTSRNPDYLYPESSIRSEKLANHSHLPVIILNDAYEWYATHWLTEYPNYPEVFICSYKCDFSCLEEAAEITDLTDGFLLYVLRFSQSDEEIMNRIQQHLPLEDYQNLCSGADRVFFCTLKE